MKKFLLALSVTALTLSACSKTETKNSDVVKTVKTTAATQVPTLSSSDKDALMAVLNTQPDETKARFEARNPQATLEYFGIQPGMTVVEALPGGGWYSKILIPYLGPEGTLIGMDYDLDMWAKFDGFVNEEFLEKRKSWPATWIKDSSGWGIENGSQLSAFAIGEMPEHLKGTADAVLLIRAAHHLNRFNQAHLADSLKDIHDVLKPSGVVGIVQHRASEDQDDGWANGDNGYLKQSLVIKFMEDNGFELAKTPSAINSNPKDMASSETDDKVWRLPPTLGTSRDNEELQAKMKAIGESDRMTLVFRKKS